MKNKKIGLVILLLVAFNFSWSQNGISINDDFQGGNIGTIGKLTDTHWVCAVKGEVDSQNRNRQASWYYFRVDNAKDREIVIDLTNLTGEYNFKYGIRPISSENEPAISYDQKTWTYLPKEQVVYDEVCGMLTMTFTPKKEKVWVAHIQPYTNAELDRVLSSYEQNPMLVTESLGKTPENRDMKILTLTNTQIPEAKKRVVWLMARQHAWESGTSWILEGLINYLLASEQGSSTLGRYIFKIIPMGDPDGVARGGVRFNAFGHDLNRNWDLVLPEQMPEIFIQKGAIKTWLAQGNPIDLFITLHNTSSDYMAGPNLKIGHELHQLLSENASFHPESGLRLLPSNKGVINKGRMSVIDALWFEENIPSYLIETNIRYLDNTNQRRTIDDWLKFGVSLGKTLHKLNFN